MSEIAVSISGDTLTVSATDGYVRKVSASAINVLDGDNTQDIRIRLANSPDPGPQRMEFFESLQQATLQGKVGLKSIVLEMLRGLAVPQRLEIRLFCWRRRSAQESDSEA